MIRRLSHKLFRELLPFIKLYYGNIVSRNVLILGIPSPFVIVLTLWSLLLGPGAVPTDTTLSNSRHHLDSITTIVAISTTSSPRCTSTPKGVSLLEQKLTTQLIDWYINYTFLGTFTEDKENYLEHPIPAAPVAQPGQQVPLRLLQLILHGLKGKTERTLLQTVREFHTCKQEEGQSVSSHVLKMKGYIDNLERLGQPVGQNLAKNQLAKKDANPALHAIRAGRVQKNQKNKSHKAGKGGQGKGKNKMGYAHNNVPFAPKPKTPPPPKKDNPAKDAICHQCGEVGHWRRNCPVYLAELMKKKKLSQGASASVDYWEMARKSYSHKVERAKDLLGLIHTDVCGPFRIVSRQEASYFVTFTDDFSRYGYVYLLKHKHEVFETFKVFQKEVENQLGKTIKSLRSGHGGEYISQEFLDHLKEHGIIAHRTPPYTPQNHGVSERRNRTLLDMVRSMMSQTTLPKSFWDYALETAARILNMVPTKKVDKTPYEIWHGQAPKLGSVEDLELIQEEDTNPSVDTSLNHEEDDQEIDEPQSDINPIHRSTRTRRPTDRLCLYIDTEEHELGDLGEPANYKAALLDPESKKWLDAMNVEMQSMKDNDTDMDGAIYVFKARLVAKGFTQTYGVDYEETFSPVADIRAIRILIAIAAFYDYEIWQMDVKTAFLNGHLSEEVYMTQPEGFVNPKYPNHVCKLKRSIYGLKQASRQWNKRFDDEIKKFGFTQNRDEPCVYQKASGSYVTFLILYVDDILIMGNNIPMLQDVKSYLGRCFAMKDLGEAAYILGIKIYRDRSKRLISLCQSAYIEKILKRYYMENSKRGTIPMQDKLKLSKSDGASTPAEKRRMSNVPYASVVGSIIYVVRCTRPDVAFGQNITSRFQQNPGKLHWTTVKNILKYLRNTKDMFLVYGGDMKRELRVSYYADAGYLTDADDLSTKQSIFATSSTDAEYIAAFDTSKEAAWIHKFISGLNVVPTIEEPMYCDNTGAIVIAKESGITKEKVHTDDNVADPFTKALAFPKHSEHTMNIGMLPASSFMQVCDD
ncbi:retrotransposon protein, putative, ty1-copia subclass [Tanacetum coccineum]